MRQDTFKNRYIIKLSSSIIVAGLNAIIQVLLPIALSVKEYGVYSYNLSVFTSVVSVATLSTPNALVAKFSRRNEEVGLVNFYLKFYFFIAFFLNLFVIVGYGFGYTKLLFQDQTIVMVLLGVESAIVLRLNTDCCSIFDAMAISRFPAVVQSISKVILSVLVVCFYAASTLDLRCFYLIQLSVAIAFSLKLLISFYREHQKRYPQTIDRGVKEYLREYYQYCKPLVLSNAFAEIVTIVMNWALYEHGGVEAAAVFGIAWQLNTLVSYAFSPFAELSKREFAVVITDKKNLEERYEQSIILILWISSFFALFIGVFSSWVIPVVLGDKYAGFYAVIFIIMVFTVFQAAGQVGGSFLLATEQTKICAIITVLGQILKVVAVFAFQIPNTLFPAGLGAEGMALTYLISNGITVVVQDMIIVKKLSINISCLINRIVPIAICTILSAILRLFTGMIIVGEGVPVYVYRVLLSGTFYVVILLALFIWKPVLFGVKSIDLNSIFKQLRFDRKD